MTAWLFSFKSQLKCHYSGRNPKALNRKSTCDKKKRKRRPSVLIISLCEIALLIKTVVLVYLLSSPNKCNLHENGSLAIISFLGSQFLKAMPGASVISKTTVEPAFSSLPYS
jgi:hypothetical protein